MTDKSKRTFEDRREGCIHIGPVLTRAEQRRIWEAAATLDVSGRLAVSLMLEMGLRAHEVCALTYEAIQPDALMIMTKKLGQARTVPFGVKTRLALTNYLATCPPNREADQALLQVDVTSLREMVRTLGSDANLGRPLSMHDLRRAAISNANIAHRKGGGK